MKDSLTVSWPRKLGEQIKVITSPMFEFALIAAVSLVQLVAWLFETYWILGIDENIVSGQAQINTNHESLWYAERSWQILVVIFATLLTS